MNIALAQIDVVWEDKHANREAITALMDGLLPGTDLLVLPEMTLSGFSMNTGATLDRDGSDYAFFSELARQRSIHLCCGLVLSRGDSRLNTQVVFTPEGKVLAEYAKMHTFTYAGESDHYGRGQSPVICRAAGVRLAPLVCFDLRFAPVFWNLAPRVDLFVIIANWPAVRREHWITLLRARAVENQCYVAGVNRVGRDAAGLDYSGDSLLVSPLGDVVLDCGADACLGYGVCNPAEVARVRQDFPFLKDRRPDRYFPREDDA